MHHAMQLYSPFFFFNCFEFDSICMCVCANPIHTHQNRSLEWTIFRERKKNMSWINTHINVRFFSSIVKRNNKTEFVACVKWWNCMNDLSGKQKRALEPCRMRAHMWVITLGIMLCECTHHTDHISSYTATHIWKGKNHLQSHFRMNIKRNNLTVIKNEKFQVILSCGFFSC